MCSSDLEPTPEPEPNPEPAPEPQPVPEPQPEPVRRPPQPAPVPNRQPQPPVDVSETPPAAPAMAEDVARPPVTPPQPADADYGNEGPATLMVNNRIFELEYQVDDVGPSGISAVDLFVTEDNGKQWFRYGNDSDRRSPFSVDTMAEGTFGFAVRVRNGVGVADIPPQPGTEPEIKIGRAHV